MFTFLNNLLRPHPKKRRNRGQAALLLILIIAVVIVLWAISINFGRIAQVKTQTIIASNISAAYMASQIASYAEYLYQNVLDGGSDLYVCKYSGIIPVIVGVIVVVILAIITIYSGGATTPMLIAAWVGLISAIAGGAIYVEYVNPAITDQINKNMAKFSQQDQFLERGIMVGLQNVVSDSATITDIDDDDTDGICANCGSDGEAEGDRVHDKIGRFAHYYLRRVGGTGMADADEVARQRARRFNINLIKRFQSLLGQFLYKAYKSVNDEGVERAPVDDGWGLWDPWRDSCDGQFQQNAGEHLCCDESRDPAEARPAECNCCCFPGQEDPPFDEVVTDEDGRFWYYKNGYAPRSDCCVTRNEDLMCHAGDLDDMPIEYCADDDNRSWPYTYDPYYENDTNGFVSFKEFLGHDDESPNLRIDPDQAHNRRDYITQIADNYGYYRSSDATGFFPLLWQLANNTNLSIINTNTDKEGCFWWTTDNANCNNDDPIPGSLVLPHACAGDGCRVPPLASIGDSMGNLSTAGHTPVLIPDTECAGSARWKKGDNQFCSEVWPYNINCPGKIYVDLEGHEVEGCVEDNATNWTEDSFDFMVHDIDAFIAWADKTAAMEPKDILSSFSTMYRGIMGYIGTPDGGVSKLSKWKAGFESWRVGLTRWRDALDGAGVIAALNTSMQQLTTCVAQCRDADAATNCGADAEADILPAPLLALLGYRAPSCAAEGFRNEVDNLLVKIRFRRDYLVRTRTAINGAIAGLQQMIDNISQLQDDIEELHLETTINPPEGPPESLPSDAIYAWKSGKGCLDGMGNPAECWHVVKVEGRIPGRCEGHCGRPGRYEPDWPYIKSFNKGFLGSKLCEAVGDSFEKYGNCDEDDDYDDAVNCFKGGVVKSRVIRFDQDKSNLLQFANQIPIWKFIFHHPEEGGVSMGGIRALDQYCQERLPGGELSGANMALTGSRCQDVANIILKHGIMTQTCAEYFWHNGPPWGFNVKFAPCDPAPENW